MFFNFFAIFGGPTDRQTDRPTDRQTDQPTDLGIKAPSRSLKTRYTIQEGRRSIGRNGEGHQTRGVERIGIL